jgi:glycolate oxidase iron-sulfur subunit
MTQTEQPNPVGPAGTFRGFITSDAPRDEDLYKCVHCGFCLNACPTYLETGLEMESPRGRIALMKGVREGRLQMTPQVVKHWDLCLQCRACEVACPSGVPYGRLMEATRAEVEEQFKRPFKERLARNVGYNSVLTSPSTLRWVGRAAKFYRKTGMQSLARKTGLLGVLPGDSEYLDKSMPEMSDRFFVADGRVIPAQGERRAKVALLAGCVMALMHAPAMEAAVRVLTRNGVEVRLTARQGCCGALNAHAGELESARKMARRNIDSFLTAMPDAVIVASAGCGSTMKEYDELLHGDRAYQEKAQHVSSLTRDIHEFLIDLGLRKPQAELNYTVAYQDACHLANAQRITTAPRQVLDSIPGLKRVEMPEATVCCGSAGTYSITQKEMSQRLGRRKARNIESTGAQVVATGNPGCALQIANALQAIGSRARVRYVVELLDAAYAKEGRGQAVR